MADQVVARQQGDDFQARIFWLEAANLLREESPVQAVMSRPDQRRLMMLLSITRARERRKITLGSRSSVITGNASGMSGQVISVLMT